MLGAATSDKASKASEEPKAAAIRPARPAAASPPTPPLQRSVSTPAVVSASKLEQAKAEVRRRTQPRVDTPTHRLNLRAQIL